MGDIADYYLEQEIMHGRWEREESPLFIKRHRASKQKQNSRPSAIPARPNQNQRSQEIMEINNQAGEVQTIGCAQVRFIDGPSYKTYDFKTWDDLMPGELVVVDTQNGYSLARVEIMLKGMSPKATRWIVARVDVAAYEARMAAYKQAEELKRAMEKRRKELTDMQVYEELAKTDEQMAHMLGAYKRANITQAAGTPLGIGYTPVVPPRPVKRPEPSLYQQAGEAYLEENPPVAQGELQLTPEEIEEFRAWRKKSEDEALKKAFGEKSAEEVVSYFYNAGDPDTRYTVDFAAKEQQLEEALKNPVCWICKTTPVSTVGHMCDDCLKEGPADDNKDN